MWSTPAVWKQYNKMAVLHFFLINSPLIYILFSMVLDRYLPIFYFKCENKSINQSGIKCAFRKHWNSFGTHKVKQTTKLLYLIDIHSFGTHKVKQTIKLLYLLDINSLGTHKVKQTTKFLYLIDINSLGMSGIKISI